MYPEKIRAAVRKGVRSGLPEALSLLRERSQELVPVRTGALRASCRVSAGDTGGTVSYDTPYAVQVHEDMTAHHPSGQAKFLEQPASDGALGEQMAGKLAGQIRKCM